MMINAHTAKFLFAVRIHPQGWFFIRWGMFITAIFLFVDMKTLGTIGALSTFGVLLFFRDPQRFTPQIQGSLMSPADGIVMEIVHQAPPEMLQRPGDGDKEWQKVGIFLAPWHVHVNRIPIAGYVENKVYQEGNFSQVAVRQTPLHNEHLGITIRTQEGYDVFCVQIAGFLARRIICDTKSGEKVEQGNRYGIICFGSRVDLYFPTHLKLMVREGQKVMAGESLIALDAGLFLESSDELEKTN